MRLRCAELPPRVPPRMPRGGATSVSVSGVDLQSAFGAAGQSTRGLYFIFPRPMADHVETHI